MNNIDLQLAKVVLHSCMNWTPATPVGLPRALFAASPKTETAFSAPFWCSASPLDATLPSALVCVASKELTISLTSLDATLTKNRGVGAVMVNQTSYTLLPSTRHGTRTAERVSPTTDRSDTILGGFPRRSEMSTKVGTWMVLALVGAALVCGPVVVAQQEPDWSKVQIKVTKVSGNIYMLEGEGGNIAASVGEDGIVIVDDQFAPLAEKIQAALRELKITDKPVRFVINTHYHGDHTGGNVPFSTAGSTVIAQDNVRKRLESGGTAGNGGSIKMEVKPAPKAALPIITFEHDVNVHLNGEDLRAHRRGFNYLFSQKQCGAHGRRFRALRVSVH